MSRTAAQTSDLAQLSSPYQVLRHLATFEDLTRSEDFTVRCLELWEELPCLRRVPIQKLNSHIPKLWLSMYPTNSGDLLEFALHRAQHGRIGRTPSVVCASLEIALLLAHEVDLVVSSARRTAQHFKQAFGVSNQSELYLTARRVDRHVWIYVGGQRSHTSYGTLDQDQVQD